MTKLRVHELAKELDVSVEELAAAMDADRDVESIYATVYQGDISPVFSKTSFSYYP